MLDFLVSQRITDTLREDLGLELFIVVYNFLHEIISYPKDPLLIISEENLDRQPRITTDLESIWKIIQLLYFLRCQLPAIKLEVVLNARFCNRLGNDRPSLLNTPGEKDLCRCLAFLLCYGFEGLVAVKRRVSASKARVTCGVDSLGGVVCDKLGGGVVGMQLDLVDRWDDLERGQQMQ